MNPRRFNLDLMNFWSHMKLILKCSPFPNGNHAEERGHGDDLMCFKTKKSKILNSESHPGQGIGFSKKSHAANSVRCRCAFKK